MSVRHVLLLSSEQKTVSAVSSALASNGRLDPHDVYRELNDVKSRLNSGPIPAVLVDIDAAPRQMLSAIEPLAHSFTETRFVVLSETMHSDLILEAMQAGARHFMLKSCIEGDLHNTLKRLCPPTANGKIGSAVTILSAGGGCGATTVAVNLAAELAGLDKPAQPPLVVDLDRHYGAVSTYLSVDGEYGVHDLLERAGSLDAQLIRSTALESAQNAHVLISNSTAGFGQQLPLDPARVGPLVSACKASYRWTVIDAPRVSMDSAAELAKSSDTTLLLMQLSIKDVRVARQVLTAMAERGVPESEIRILVNRYRRRGLMFTLEQARDAMGMSPTRTLECLSNDYKSVAEAGNLGKPLMQVAPRSDFRVELQKLALALASETKAARPHNGSFGA